MQKLHTIVSWWFQHQLSCLGIHCKIWKKKMCCKILYFLSKRKWKYIYLNKLLKNIFYPITICLKPPWDYNPPSHISKTYVLITMISPQAFLVSVCENLFPIRWTKASWYSGMICYAMCHDMLCHVGGPTILTTHLPT